MVAMPRSGVIMPQKTMVNHALRKKPAAAPGMEKKPMSLLSSFTPDATGPCRGLVLAPLAQNRLNLLDGPREDLTDSLEPVWVGPAQATTEHLAEPGELAHGLAYLL